jgi:hypothetical protein
VDSKKERLLSPCSKNNEKFNDRNTAVGKAKSLGRTLRWLNADLFHWKWIRMVRDRFFTRMGPFLPDISSGVYWHLLLPESLGGLGLWLEEDIPNLTRLLPAPSKKLLQEVFEDNVSKDLIALFRGFTSNKSYRGYLLSETDVSLAQEILIPEAITNLGESKTLPELVKQFHLEEKAAGSQYKILLRKDWLTEDSIKDAILRPLLFKEMLSGEAKESAFNTETFKRRYTKLWDLTYSGSIVIDEEVTKKALRFKERQRFYYCGEKLEIPIRGQIRNVNLLEELTFGLPDLSVRWTEVGILTTSLDEPPPEAEDVLEITW